MVVFVLLFFFALFAVAAIAISWSARKRRGGGKPREINPRADTPTIGRANSDED